MKKNKRIESALATNNITYLRRPSQTALVLCERCGCGMLLLEEAVAVAGVSSRALYRSVEAGALHFAETRDGLLLLCLNSMLATQDNRE